MVHAGAPSGPDVNPDVVRAIASLRAGGVLSTGQAAFFDRVARRGLVSVRFEIRTLLYVGVLLLTSGVGVLVALHQEENRTAGHRGRHRPRGGRQPDLGRPSGRAVLVG